MSKADPKKLEEKKLEDLKKWAVKSGYPLENQIEKFLKDVSWDGERKILRNYSFEAEDEQNNWKIRSIDFVASFSIKTSTIRVPGWQTDPEEGLEVHVIVDSKSSTEGAFWFTPDSSNTKVALASLVPVLLEDPFFKCPAKIHRKEFLEASEGIRAWKVAVSGKKVGENDGRDLVYNSAIQVTQGFMSILEPTMQLIGQPHGKGGHYYRKGHIYLILVVTDAELLMMKEGVTPEIVAQASSVEEFCEPVSKVLVQQPNLFHLRNSLASLSASTKHVTKGGFGWLDVNFEGTPVGFVGIAELPNVLSSILDHIKTICQS